MLSPKPLADTARLSPRRENIDTGGPLGRAVMVIAGAVAELERNLIIERVKSGMRRAKLEGRHIGRKPLVVDRASIFRHHIHGHSLKEILRTFNISRTSVARIIRAEKKAMPKGGVQMRLEELEKHCIAKRCLSCTERNAIGQPL